MFRAKQKDQAMQSKAGYRGHVMFPRLAVSLLAMIVAGVCAGRLTAAAPETGSPEPDRALQLREGMREMIAAARDRVFPSLVHVHVVTVNYWGGKERKGQAVGSGTIISPEGHVLTNCHVTMKGKKFKCVLADKQEIAAERVGEDPLTDLAVLKLDLSELKDSDTPLPVAQYGDSDAVEVGDYVMAMGSPLALARSVTLGIVSNTERTFAGSRGDDEPGEMRLERHQRTGLFNRWIQHDAAINPGNSGGPLVNLKGEVVGVNTRGTFFGGDMGFAIPSNLAREVADLVVQHGEVPRSWLGLSLKPIKKTGLERGVLVNSVVEDGPADKAGIKAGDVITEIGGKTVTVWFPEEVPPLLKHLADLPIGETLRITYQRDEKTMDATLVTEKLQKDRGDEAAFRAWGITAMAITEKIARDRRLDTTKGVLVMGVRNGGPAQVAEPAISHGDVILSIDGNAIEDLDGFIGRYETIMESDDLPEHLVIEFDRRGKNHVTLIKPKPDKDEDPPREVRKAWVGIATQPVLKKLADKLGHPDRRGFRITRVYPKTLAAGSDLRVGDIIVSLNGKKVSPRGMQDTGLLARRIRKLDIDDEASLTALRGGETHEVTVQLEPTRITPAEARRDRNRDFELTVREVTFFDRDENRWDEDVHGVLVERVEPGGWAGLGGIRTGDLIQRLDKHDVKGLQGYRKAMEAVPKAQPERVVFVVLRGTRTHFQYIEPDWGPLVPDQQDRDADGEITD